MAQFSRVRGKNDCFYETGKAIEMASFFMENMPFYNFLFFDPDQMNGHV